MAKVKQNNVTLYIYIYIHLTLNSVYKICIYFTHENKVEKYVPIRAVKLNVKKHKILMNNFCSPITKFEFDWWISKININNKKYIAIGLKC